MSLFQKSVLNKYLKGIDEKQVNEAWERFKSHFHNAAIQENIRRSKEEQHQGEFLIDLFVKVLGYTNHPLENYNLIREQKNVKDAKSADGAIIKDGKIIAVIELKGTDTTDLGKIEVQAFGYKNNQPDAVYVITSNFEKLRFYIDHSADNETFNLFQLTREEFNLLWLCLAKENIFNGIPKQIKDESVIQEESVTKKLYKDYSLFRNELFESIVKKNPDFDKLTLFKKTQKLLDRFLFILFAEDRSLIPPNLMRTIINKWTDLRDEHDMYQPLYQQFIKYFSYLNSGYKGKNYEIFAYNGGLFEPDDILDNIQIEDTLLYKHTLNLSVYDFESEVSVNILGHIFEHSLSEIEEIQAELEGQLVDKSKTKRKKDGVFYTPKYITKYIVDNTVGSLCKQKKAEFGIVEEEYEQERSGKQNKTKVKVLQDKLEQYRNWLLGITICDPACGSGAFLNQALEFLISEHGYIDELQAKLFGDGLVFQNIENSILENNLFGVDINDESIEIAKLSLWLRTAQKGRKLTSLNNNIKCGNSLIADKTVAGDKAFDWENEFPEVFAKGGFDIVIGNPPYVKLEVIKEESRKLENQGFVTFDKRGDLYVLFVEKGFSILKPNGYISYIMPNKWLQSGYGKPLRKFFLTKGLKELIDFGDIQIFKGATTYPVIFTAINSLHHEEINISVLEALNTIDFNSNVASKTEIFKFSDFSEDTWVISSPKDKKILQRIKNKFVTLNQFVEGNAFRGVLTGLTEAFVISEATRKNIIIEDSISESFIHPFLQGRDITNYSVATPKNYLILFEKGFTKQRLGNGISETDALAWLDVCFHRIHNWLIQFENKAKKRTDKGDYWWELRACDYYAEFKKPKIMYQKFQVKPCFIYDDQGLFCNDSMWIIPTSRKGLTGILNSKMGWWLITKYCTQIQNGVQLIWDYFGQIPIPEFGNELDELVMNIIELNQHLLQKKNKFFNRVQSNIFIENLSNKIAKFYIYDFKVFVAELKKQKIQLTLSEQDEWEDYFNKYKTEINQLLYQIQKTDQKINELVYQLYELTPEEIKIVESQS